MEISADSVSIATKGSHVGGNGMESPLTNSAPPDRLASFRAFDESRSYRKLAVRANGHLATVTRPSDLDVG